MEKLSVEQVKLLRRLLINEKLLNAKTSVAASYHEEEQLIDKTIIDLCVAEYEIHKQQDSSM